LNLEVVLPNGEIIWTGANTLKNATGYNLTQLFVGSEGTLGIIPKAWLKVFPLPSYRLIMSAYFATLEDAGRAVFQVTTRGLSPSAAELMDKNTMTAVSKYINMDFPDCAAMLIFEFDGSFLGEVKTRMRRAQKLCEMEGATGVAVTDTKEESDRLWQARKSALPALATLKPTVKPSTMLEDVTVPISKVPEMLVQIEKTAQKHGVLISTFGHAGDGNLHPVIIYDERSTEDVERARRAAADIFNFGLQLGGTLSGEHGIGLSKAPHFAKEHGEAEIEVMKKIKGVLDPKGVLNPGKIWLEPR
ncbi:MAG: FAD-linked oxidase C-terminal domain-containing protein, partial [Candidatus Bathyarchaeia archaeon]